MPRKNLPGYLRHKPSGQAYCLINGKFIYLGKFGSKASRQQYEEVIAEYLANGKKLPPTRSQNEITILEFAISYLEYAKEYYSTNASTFNLCENTMKLLVKHYGNHNVSAFSPLSLKFLREKWIDERLLIKCLHDPLSLIAEKIPLLVDIPNVENQISPFIKIFTVGLNTRTANLAL